MSSIVLTFYNLLQHVCCHRLRDDAIGAVGHEVLHILGQHVASHSEDEAFEAKRTYLPTKQGWEGGVR